MTKYVHTKPALSETTLGNNFSWQHCGSYKVEAHAYYCDKKIVIKFIDNFIITVIGINSALFIISFKQLREVVGKIESLCTLQEYLPILFISQTAPPFQHTRFSK